MQLYYIREISVHEDELDRDVEPPFSPVVHLDRVIVTCSSYDYTSFEPPPVLQDHGVALDSLNPSSQQILSAP